RVRQSAQGGKRVGVEDLWPGRGWHVAAVGGSGLCARRRLRAQRKPPLKIRRIAALEGPGIVVCRWHRPALSRGGDQPKVRRGTLIGVAPGKGRDGGAHA